MVSISNTLGEIDSLYAQPSTRGRGVGDGLMSVGLEWLTQHKPKNIRLSVGQGNEQAISYYEKFGFKQRATVMQLFS